MFKYLVMSALCGSMLFAVVDINSASKDDLMKVKGIGEKKADAILEYRKNKCFDNVNELDNVNGFGAKTVEALKSEIEAKPCVRKTEPKTEPKTAPKTEQKHQEIKKDVK